MGLKRVLTLAVSAALLPLWAQADGLSYSHLDAAYVTTDVDDFSQDVDGLALRGSVELTERVFAFAGFTTQSTSILGSDLDVKSYDLGVGYAWPLSPTADLYGKVHYLRAEADYAGFDADDDGYGLSAGVRSRIMDQLELEGSVRYTDLSDSGHDTALGLGARWYFSRQLAVGVEGEFGDDAKTYGIGVRWTFGD
ncbi:MAG: outer membrane beta-barrel protein [Gammaproteobacteria bacterium]|nr:outer membrane beta-barrel protein [Gammaproteobacteria bacterium]